MDYLGVDTLVLNICNFPDIFIWISNLSPLCSEKIICIISVFLNLLHVVLWPTVWSIVTNVSGALEENVSPTVVIDSAARVFYIFTDFLSVLPIIKRRLLKTAINSGLVYFSFEICQILKLYYLVCAYSGRWGSLDKQSPLSLWNGAVYPCNILRS